MTTSISSTGSVNSLGIGSGLDANSIISSLMAADSQPLTLLQNKASTISTQISAVGKITSLSSAVADASQKLSDPSFWSQTSATSADTTAVTATTASGTATPGDYSVSVAKLAQTQTVTSAALPSSDATLNSGTLTIQLGTWNSTTNTFTNKDGASPVSITIGPGDTSLSSIRDKINAAGAGVTATIINDANGSRLSLRSAATGEENGFKISATEDSDDGNPATGLSSLAFDPAAPAASQSMTLNQSAQNAEATINGIDIESDSNTLSNVSDGLSLTLLKQTTSPIDVSVATDTATMTTAVQSFISAYNALNAEIHTDTKYDPGGTVAAGTSVPGGPLEGDPSIISYQNQLKGIFNVSSSLSPSFNSLSSIGISIQKDGSLALDSGKLDAGLAQPDQMKALLATQGSTPQSTGLMVQFANLASQSTVTGGSLYSRNAGLQGELSRNQDQQTEMQTHLDDEQARLTKQYQALDTTMSQMSALSSYVTQQVAMLAKN